jgi:hypothetical protein
LSWISPNKKILVASLGFWLSRLCACETKGKLRAMIKKKEIRKYEGCNGN